MLLSRRCECLAIDLSLATIVDGELLVDGVLKVGRDGSIAQAVRLRRGNLRAVWTTVAIGTSAAICHTSSRRVVCMVGQLALWSSGRWGRGIGGELTIGNTVASFGFTDVKLLEKAATAWCAANVWYDWNDQVPETVLSVLIAMFKLEIRI